MTCQVLGTGDPAMSQCPPGGDYIPAGRQATDRKIRLSNMKEKKKKVAKSKGDGDEPGHASLML